MKRGEKRRDRAVTRAIHRLYFQSNWQDWPNFVFSIIARFWAEVIYNVFIPVQIAYGIQAIVDRQFDAVEGHAWTIFLLALAYSVLWGAGGVAVIRCLLSAAYRVCQLSAKGLRVL